MTGPDITSPANPRIRALARLERRRERERTGRFLVEGAREIARALEAGLVVELLVALDAAGHPLVARCTARGIPLLTVAEAVLARLSRRARPDGLVAVAAGLDTTLPDPLGSLVLVADAIEKPGNLGAMIRTAEAVGASFAASDPVTDLANPNVIRASQGAVFLATVGAGPAPEVARRLPTGTTVVVATPEAPTPYWDLDLTVPAAIVVGSEHRGVASRWRSLGIPVRIPMVGRVDSLNASVAAAVLLFEAARQRSRH